MATTYDIKQGMGLELKGQLYEFVRRISNEDMQFMSVENGKLLNLKDKKLSFLIKEKGAKLLKSVLSARRRDKRKLTPKEARDSEIVILYVREFRKSKINPKSSPGRKEIKRIWTLLNDKEFYPHLDLSGRDAPSGSTIYSWLRESPEDLTEGGCAPNHSGKGRKRFAGWQDWVLEIIEEAFGQLYLKAGKETSISVVKGAVDLKINEILGNKEIVNRLGGLQSIEAPVVNEEQLRKYLRSMDLHEYTSKRFGKAFADHIFRAVFPKSRPSRPLEIVELDATRLDVTVIWNGQKVVNPWITVIVDLYSRMIVGFHLSASPPSIQTVAEALKNAMFDKEYVKHFKRIDGEWPCFGFPELIVVDRGKENISNDVLQMAKETGLNIKVLPGRSPWMKGVVERFFRTLNQGLIHSLPATTLSNYMMLGRYKPLKDGCIEIDDLYECLHWWIIDVYSKRFHMGILNYPIDVWEEGVRDYPVQPVLSAEKLNLWCMKNKPKKLNREGITLSYLKYCSDEVVAWLRDPRVNKAKDCPTGSVSVNVKYNPADMGYVMVEHPETEEWLRVDVVDSQKDYASGLSEWQHDKIRAESRLGLKDKYPDVASTNAEIIQYAIKIKQRIKSETESRKGGQKSARMAGLSLQASTGNDLVLPTHTVSGASAQEDFVDEVELVNDDYDPYKKKLETVES